MMLKNEARQDASSPHCEPFVTIDDLAQQAHTLSVGLERLCEFKYPLDIRRGIRKGVGKSMTDDTQSRQIKAAGRTYFLDLQKTKEDKPYLRITESRKGDGEKFERNSINVFPEDAAEFTAAVSAMAEKLA